MWTCLIFTQSLTVSLIYCITLFSQIGAWNILYNYSFFVICVKLQTFFLFPVCPSFCLLFSLSSCIFVCFVSFLIFFMTSLLWEVCPCVFMRTGHIADRRIYKRMCCEILEWQNWCNFSVFCGISRFKSGFICRAARRFPPLLHGSYIIS